MSFLTDFFKGGAEGLLTGASDIIDKFVESPEDKLKAKEIMLKAEKENQDRTAKAKQAYFDDRNSARELGKTDPWTPRILTLVYTVGFFGLTGFMLKILFGAMEVEVPSHILMFVSTIFGSFSTIMVQIISYYFGASKGGDEQAGKMSDSFKEAAKVKAEEDKKKL